MLQCSSFLFVLFVYLFVCLILRLTQWPRGFIMHTLRWATAGTQSARHGGSRAGGVVSGVSVTGWTLWGERDGSLLS